MLMLYFRARQAKLCYSKQTPNNVQHRELIKVLIISPFRSCVR